MVWKALATLMAHRSWKAVVQRLRLGLWKQSWHQAWEVWRVMEASRQTLAVVSQFTPLCSHSSSRVTPPREGLLQPPGAPGWGIRGCLSLGQFRSQSMSDAQQYLTWFLLFLQGRGTVCSIQNAARSVGGITCML